MAALVVNGSFELAAFRRHLVARLPAYARPVLLRIVREIEVTITFKQKKSDLVQEGYDPRVVKDAVFCDDASRESLFGWTRSSLAVSKRGSCGCEAQRCLGRSPARCLGWCLDGALGGVLGCILGDGSSAVAAELWSMATAAAVRIR